MNGNIPHNEKLANGKLSNGKPVLNGHACNSEANGMAGGVKKVIEEKVNHIKVRTAKYFNCKEDVFVLQMCLWDHENATMFR